MADCSSSNKTPFVRGPQGPRGMTGLRGLPGPQGLIGPTTSSLTGTANQVLVDGTSGTPQTGSLILSLPQDISTSSSPTFAGLTLSGHINMTLASASSDALTTKVTGDTQNRFVLNADGSMERGSGSAAADTGTSRGGVGIYEFKLGSQAHTVRVYGSASKYLSMSNDGTDSRIFSATTSGRLIIGTTDAEDLLLVSSNSTRWSVLSTGHLVGATDNVYDIGASGATRPRSIYFGTQSLGANGSASAPSYSLSADTNSGLYGYGADNLGISVAGIAQIYIAQNAFTFVSSMVFGWAAGGADAGAPDVAISRVSAGIAKVTNGASACAWRVHGDATNYLSIAHNNINGEIVSSLGNVNFTSNGALLTWDGSQLYPGTNNSRDLGSSPSFLWRNIYFGTQILGPNGTAAAPSYAFSGSSGSGFRWDAGAGLPKGVSSGTDIWAWSGAGLIVNSGDAFAFSSTTDPGAALDVLLVRDAAAVLALKNGATAQEFRVYGTTTGPVYTYVSNDGSGGYLKTNTGPLTIGTTAANVVALSTSDVPRWYISSTGVFYPNGASTHDLGDATNTVRNIYFGTQILAPNGTAGAPPYSNSVTPTIGMYFVAGDVGFSTGSAIFIGNGIGIRNSAAGGNLYLDCGNLHVREGTGASTQSYLHIGSGATLTDISIDVLALQRTTNPQTFRVYGTTTGPKYLEMTHDGTNGVIRTPDASPIFIQTVGAGVINLNTTSVTRWTVTAGGLFTPGAANTYDLGDSTNTVRNIYFGTQSLGPNGTAAAPSYSFSSNASSGMYNVSGVVGFSSGGTYQFDVNSIGASLGSTSVFSWHNDATISGTVDVILARDAAAVLALKNGTVAQTMRIYGTITSSQYLELGNDGGGVAFVRASSGGSNVLRLGAAGASHWQILATGHCTPVSGNTYDLGDSTNTVRSGYFGTSVLTPVISNAGAIIIQTTTASDISFKINSVTAWVINNVSPYNLYPNANDTYFIGAASFRVLEGHFTSLLIDTNGLTMRDAKNIILNATTGTKIGTATTQKLGFYNATPVVQGASVADATDAASAITQLNALISRIEATGLIATV